MKHQTHTEGPWSVDPVDQYLITADKDGLVVADISCEDRLDYEQLYNSHLVAAAPDLLEALEKLADLMDAVISGEYKPDSYTGQSARIAIAKARGESLLGVP